jgi:predicted porin
MKKIVMVLAGLLLLSSVAVASPLTDYSQGRFAIDLTWRNTADYFNGDFNRKYNLDAGITLGLCHNFAFQYRNFSPESANTAGFVAKGQFNEYNVLYKLDKGFSVFAGWVTSKSTSPVGGVSVSTDTENYWQAGVIGSTRIAPNLSLWGVAAAGEDLTNFEAGISYQFTPNVEFNVNYRTIETKRLTPMVPVFIKGKASGYGFGLTFKY